MQEIKYNNNKEFEYPPTGYFMPPATVNSCAQWPAARETATISTKIKMRVESTYSGVNILTFIHSTLSITYLILFKFYFWFIFLYKNINFKQFT